MLKQMYEFGGLNLRQSDIVRPENQASDLQNVILDKQGQLKKRSGFSEAVDMLGVPVIDTLEYRKTRELLIMTPTGLGVKKGNSFENVNFGGDPPPNGWGGIDFAEYSNSLYFTDTDGKTELFKYDGYMAYRAGIPKVVATSNGLNGTYYYRLVYYHIDLQGNTTFGDYLQIGPITTGSTFTIDTMLGTEFHNKFSKVSAIYILDSLNLVIPVSTHNYIAGDSFRAREKTNFTFKVLDIVSVTPTSITVSSSSVGADSFDYLVNEPIEHRTNVLIARSSNLTFGYIVENHLAIDSSAATQDIAVSIATTLPSKIPLNDVYDTGIVRGLPPRCRHITVYGGTTLVLGNLADTKDLQPDLQNTTPQQESVVFWSSVYSEFGTSVENFLPFYRRIIGKSDEGSINGLFGSGDSLVVLKENQVYYISGILQTQNIRIINSLSERIGCVSHRSIVEAQGGCLFASKKGIYLAQHGKKPIEITDFIEPIFTNDTTGLDMSKSRGVIDFIKEKIYWFIPATLTKDSLVLELDYYYKEWFKHKGIDASSGFTIVNDVDIYHADGTKIYLQDGSLNDGLLPIHAYYATTWFNIGAPSIRKKFTNFILLSLSSKPWDCRIRTQEDWIEVDRTDVTIVMDGIKKVDDKRLNITQSKSCRFIIENNEKNQDMLISGYEFEYEATQDTPKGES